MKRFFCVLLLLSFTDRINRLITQAADVPAVGFMNLWVPGHSLSLLANTFKKDLVLDKLRPRGIVAADGLKVYHFDTSTGTHTVSTYDAAGDKFSPPVPPLKLGEGFFVANSGEGFTLTLTGEMAQGTLNYDLSKGMNLIAFKIPAAGSIPHFLNMPEIPGAQVFIFDNARQTYHSFIFDDLTLEWQPEVPYTAFPGQGFWLCLPENASWTMEYHVDQ